MTLSIIVGGTPVSAEQQSYTYAIVHPFYGKIGTLTDTIDRNGDVTRIHARLRVAVDLLGIVVYREESDITEVMRGDRLISLRSATDTDDGQHVEVQGEIQGGQFVVHTAAGSAVAPATVAPSDPWVLKHTGEGTMVYPDTGQIVGVRISGGDYGPVSVNGAWVSARHFIVSADKQQEVWLDNRGIPVMFRTIQSGTQIDLVLQSPAPESDVSAPVAVKLPTLVQLGDFGK